MSKELRITMDDDMYDEMMIWAKHRFGPNAKPQEYMKTAVVTLCRRDRAADEKKNKKE